MLFNKFIQAEELPLPLSDMYTVSNTGIIKDTNGNKLPIVIDQDGNKLVYLYWVNKWNYYLVAKLVLHTFKPVFMPKDYWDQLIVLYKDKDSSNINIENLVWKFGINGIESKRHPGYFFIPGHSRYIINREGKVMSYIFNKYITLTNNKPKTIKESRYVVVYVRGDTELTADKIKCKPHHRLVALTFLDYGDLARKNLVINHKNGIKNDNRVENLEIITKREDIRHAISTGLNQMSNKVKVLNVKTLEILHFKSIRECATAFNVDDETIRQRINLKRQKIFDDYIFVNEEIEFIDVANNDLKSLLAIKQRRVLVRNLKTDEVMEFDSLTQCAEHYGVTLSSMHHRAKKQNIFPGYLQFKYDIDYNPWRTPENLEEEHNRSLLHKDTPIPIECRNLKTGEVFEFSSQRDAQIFIGKDIRKGLRKNRQLIYPCYHQVKFKDGTPWRDPVNLDREIELAISRENKNGINKRFANKNK